MRRLKLHSSVATILLRDGTLYFIALLAINAFQAATPKTTSLEGGYINEILEFMPPVLVQRFIMNLRRPDSEEHEAAAGQSGTGSSINFRPPSTFLGNLGEPLDHGSAAELEQHTVNDETGSSGQEASTMI
ncbi:hypothetical protein PsYK624_125310 [Phanerochaete sordida]|uniref:Uncharacterized protein n=1 Tax=Phanerochaete sordida TaxID=48140 RepID=A0A9P3GIT4_9APHY|nr:hypothetical protein PsYK624_125310 [Phanerochaete sordida]